MPDGRSPFDSPLGTRLTLDIAGRRANCCPGVCRAAGSLGSPPDAEVNVAPLENSSHGVAWIDGSVPCPGIGRLAAPIRLDIDGGRVVRFAGPEAVVARLEAVFAALPTPRTRVLAEFGIGLNPRAHLTGRMLEDEGCAGTIHLGFGSNATIGGANRVPFHLDFVMIGPDVSLDGRPLLETREFVRMSHECIDRLRDIFQRNRTRTLLVDVRSRQEWTYGQFLDDSLAAAAFLAGRGVRPGDQVAFSMENSSELAILYFACMHLQAAILPINPAFHANDYLKILQGSNAKLLFASPGVYAGVKETLDSLAARGSALLPPRHGDRKEEDAAAGEPGFCRVPGGGQGRQPRGRRTRRGTVAGALGGACDDDVFLTMPTSGSTSTPKVINIAYSGLVRNGLTMARTLGLGRENRFYNVLPMTYLGGFYNLLLIPILAEGSLVLDGAFGVPNLYGFWENVKTFGVNTLWFTATMLSMLLGAGGRRGLVVPAEQIRIALCGMAPLAASVKKRFEERFGFVLYENYALSETTFLTTHVPGRPYKEGTVGLPLEGVEVQIVDARLCTAAAGKGRPGRGPHAST